MTKAGSKRIRYVWRVLAVDDRGCGRGDCGHDHETQDEATECPWAPPGWHLMSCCDLLVRQVRDRRIDPPRTKPARMR